MSYKNNFASRLLNCRKEMGMSQKALADILGVSDAAVNMLEKSKRSPSFEVLCALADYFDASNLEEGMYRVGIDIPAGEYKLTTTSKLGYFCVYDNSSAERQIQSNNNFESNDYITVVNGQYLLLSRCVGSLAQ